MNLIGIITILASLWVTGPSEEDKIVKSVSDYAKYNYNLKLLNSSKSYLILPSDIYSKGIGYISINYETKEAFDEMKARKMIVDIVEDYIVLLNQSPLKQKLTLQPVSPEHALIIITFKNNSGNVVATIASRSKKLTIQTADAQGKMRVLAMETYPENYFKVYGTQPPERF